MKHAVKDRLTGKIVYKTREGGEMETHQKAEKWCKRNLGERGAIVKINRRTI